MSNSDAGWVGVDLDGCLAHYEKWNGLESIGEPVPLMLKYVIDLLHQGVEVRIFTARVQEGDKAIEAIEDWCIKHIGQILPVTNVKTMDMVFLVDDRAFNVQKNTGVFLVEPPSVAVIKAHWNDPQAPPKGYKQ